MEEQTGLFGRKGRTTAAVVELILQCPQSDVGAIAVPQRSSTGLQRPARPNPDKHLLPLLHVSQYLVAQVCDIALGRLPDHVLGLAPRSLLVSWAGPAPRSVLVSWAGLAPRSILGRPLARGCVRKTTRPRTGSLEEAIHAAPKLGRQSPAGYGRIGIDQYLIGSRDSRDCVRLDRDLKLPQRIETTPSTGIPQKSPGEIHGDELVVTAACIGVGKLRSGAVRGCHSIRIGTWRDAQCSVEIREPFGRRHRPGSPADDRKTRQRHATAS